MRKRTKKRKIAKYICVGVEPACDRMDEYVRTARTNSTPKIIMIGMSFLETTFKSPRIVPIAAAITATRVDSISSPANTLRGQLLYELIPESRP
jgi:hypothetical protein